MKPSKKRELFEKYIDKIENEWELLSVPGIVTNIFKDCGEEISTTTLNKYIIEYNLDRTEASKCSHEKTKEYIADFMKRKRKFYTRQNVDRKFMQV